MKTKPLPAIIMLVAGFIDCILAIVYHQSLWEFTRQLLLVLVIFYAIGCVVKLVIDINFKEPEEQEETEENEEIKKAKKTGDEEEEKAEEAEKEDSFPQDLEDMEDIQSDAD